MRYKKHGRIGISHRFLIVRDVTTFSRGIQDLEIFYGEMRDGLKTWKAMQDGRSWKTTPICYAEKINTFIYGYEPGRTAGAG